MASAEQQALVLVDGRRRHVAIDEFPAPLPRDMRAAYAIQDHAIDLFLPAGPPIGWKLGMIAPNARRNGLRRFIGPIFGFTADKGIVSPQAGQQFAEVEILVRLGPIREPLSVEAVREGIREVRLGIEIAGSAVLDLPFLGHYAVAADLGNANAVVLGPPLERDALISLPFELSLDGEIVGAGGPAQIEGGVIQAVLEACAILAQRHRNLSQGGWFATGALTGAHPVRAGQTISARSGTLEVSCSIAAAA